MEYNVIFFHGWSYNAEFFTDIASHFSFENQFFDRGYYNKPNIPVLKNENNIAMTHSMGLFYLLEHYSLEDFDKIIVLSGFSDFCAGRDKSTVEILKKDLIKKPEKTLRRFALLCNDKKRTFSVQDIDVSLLQSDLDILMDRTIYSSLLPHRQKIYTFHGDHDIVIPAAYSHIPHKDNMIVTGAGHVYDINHNKNISGTIKSWIME